MALLFQRLISIESLTEREKECLRLLMRAMRAKDIAQATDLSVHTVNDHLKSARRKLNAPDSMAAARMLWAHEQSLVDHPQNVVMTKSGWPETGATDDTCPAEVLERNEFLPFAKAGRPWNDLARIWRLVWPLALMAALALGVGALVAGATSLTQLVLLLSR